MPSITAIVPTFNRASMLREALDALSRQTRPVGEIIVWDDGSTDGTAEVAGSAEGPIRYFRSTNGGKARALNAALAEAKGELIWICDDDDICLPDAVETLAGALERRPEAGIAGASYVRFFDDPDRAAGTPPLEAGPGYWPDLSRGSVLRHLLEDIFLFQNATLVRRHLYDAAGAFREDLPRSIDYDMIVRLALRSPIAMSDRAVFRQRKHAGDRGPAAARHSADRSGEVWKETDRRVFAGLRDLIPITLYEEMFDGAGADFVRRAALLQRACVYARRTDWVQALPDLHAATACAPHRRLSAVERGICRRAMAGKHGVAEALEPEIRHTLADFAASGPLAAEIATLLVRGTAWRLRRALRARGASADASEGVGPLLRFGVAIGGAGRLRRPTSPAPLLSERDQLPASAYRLVG